MLYEFEKYENLGKAKTKKAIVCGLTGLAGKAQINEAQERTGIIQLGPDAPEIIIDFVLFHEVGVQIQGGAQSLREAIKEAAKRACQPDWSTKIPGGTKRIYGACTGVARWYAKHKGLEFVKLFDKDGPRGAVTRLSGAGRNAWRLIREWLLVHGVINNSLDSNSAVVFPLNPRSPQGEVVIDDIAHKAAG